MLKEDRIQKFLHRVEFDDLSVDYLRRLITMAREEDLQGAGLTQSLAEPIDVTSKIINPSGLGSASITAREQLTVC